MNDCEYCHRSGHVWFQCPKKPYGWMPERLAKRSDSGVESVLSGTRDTQGQMDTPSKPVTTGKDKASKVGVAPNLSDTKPKRKDTRKGDRHSPGYMAKPRQAKSTEGDGEVSKMKDHTEDGLWQDAMANLRWAMDEGYEKQKADAINDLISVRIAIMMEDIARLVPRAKTPNDGE